MKPKVKVGRRDVKSRLVKKGKVAVGFYALRDFILHNRCPRRNSSTLQAQEALYFSPPGALSAGLLLFPVSFANSAAKDAITLVYNSRSLL